MKCSNFMCDNHDNAWHQYCNKFVGQRVGTSHVKHVDECKSRKRYNRIVSSRYGVEGYFSDNEQAYALRDSFDYERDSYHGRTK